MMMEELDKVYDADEFRKLGHQLIDMLADHLAAMQSNTPGKVLSYTQPDALFSAWMRAEEDDVMAIMKTTLQQSIFIHHPGYMGHQVTPSSPLASLAGFMGLLLNNGGAIYEMAPATSALERWVCQTLRAHFGLFEADGILTSGGTIANLTALICARNTMVEGNVWEEGKQEQYAFMVSEEAHYCIDRAVRIMGWGKTGIVSVPVDQNFRMRTDLLEEKYQEAKQNGIKVLGVVGSAPSTSTGIYDNLTEIGLFCRKKQLWFHVDGAHGGPAVFSEKYRYLMEGAQMADSLVVDAHKMMLVPALTTLLLFKNASDSYRTFSQKAAYLWSASDEQWYNYGKRTMECTKLMMSLRIYLLIKRYGVDIFGKYIDSRYDLAREMATMVQADPALELKVYPDSNIVCFRYTGCSEAWRDRVNQAIRQKMLEEGDFYIVQTVLNGETWLRVSLMNPATSNQYIRNMLDVVVRLGEEEKQEQ